MGNNCCCGERKKEPKEGGATLIVQKELNQARKEKDIIKSETIIEKYEVSPPLKQKKPMLDFISELEYFGTPATT